MDGRVRPERGFPRACERQLYRALPQRPQRLDVPGERVLHTA
jgi:hypothetical protein